MHGVDPSAGFVDHARAHTKNASFEVGDAQSLPVQTGTFDAAVAGLVLNFVPKPDLAVREMRRAVQPGGVVAAYVWDYADKMELMRYFWGDVEVRAIDAPTPFRDFDDYWQPFLGGQAPAPGYCMSLSQGKRAALRERIRAKLPFHPDGSVHLVARAWAVKGHVAH